VTRRKQAIAHPPHSGPTAKRIAGTRDEGSPDLTFRIVIRLASLAFSAFSKAVFGLVFA
jgi:hypothetical protein